MHLTSAHNMCGVTSHMLASNSRANLYENSIFLNHLLKTGWLRLLALWKTLHYPTYVCYSHKLLQTSEIHRQYISNMATPVVIQHFFFFFIFFGLY